MTKKIYIEMYKVHPNGNDIWQRTVEQDVDMENDTELDTFVQTINLISGFVTKLQKGNKISITIK